MVGPQEVPLKVKNTFIDVDDKFMNHDGDDSWMSKGFGVRMRQVSEPVPSMSGYLGSQTSSPPHISAARSPFRPDIQGCWNEELSEEEVCDEPEAEEFSEDGDGVAMNRMVTGGSWYGSLSPMTQPTPHFPDMPPGRPIGIDLYMPQNCTVTADMAGQVFRPPSQPLPAGALCGLAGAASTIPRNTESRSSALPSTVPESISMTYRGAVPGVPTASTAPGNVREAIAPPEWNGTVTVMMRNLPNKYKQQMLLEEINQAGFQGAYDFVYLPIDPETNANKGYAFLNFTNANYAWAFKMTFEGKKMLQFNSNKFVSVTPATLQGFEANHTHYSRTRVSRGDPRARPLFLRQVDTGFDVNSSTSRRRKSAIDQARRALDAEQQQQQQQQTPKQKHAAEQTPVVAGQHNVGEKLQVKFCAFCGGSIQPHFRFCQFCGQSLNFTQALGA